MVFSEFDFLYTVITYRIGSFFSHPTHVLQKYTYRKNTIFCPRAVYIRTRTIKQYENHINIHQECQQNAHHHNNKGNQRETAPQLGGYIDGKFLPLEKTADKHNYPSQPLKNKLQSQSQGAQTMYIPVNS